MTRYDVFNGDADGLCALQQLRLASPADAILVTGTKRDVRLLERIDAREGDALTVLDVSLDANRDALTRVLAAGASVVWFDHHIPGAPVSHPRLDPHIDTDPHVCTSLIVDRHLAGAHRPWAIAAAFGDNLQEEAKRLGREAGLKDPQLATLRALGESLNYNAYGDRVSDLYFDPAVLARSMRRYADPLAFAREEPVLATLQAGFEQDMAAAEQLRPFASGDRVAVYVLPDAPWARRVIGAFANRLASEHPERAHAVLAERADASYVVSLRAPVANPEGADEVARAFATGGGRKGAGGIDRLPADEFDALIARFTERYATR